MCQFMPAMDDGMPMLSCNDMDVDTIDEMAMAGEFRIFNNIAVRQSDSMAPPVMDGTFLHSIGTEGDDLSLASQLPEAAIAAIGLNFSYFMGTNDVEYDQVTSVQSNDIDFVILTGTPGTVGSPIAQTSTTVYFDSDGYAREPGTGTETGSDEADRMDDNYITTVAATGEGDSMTPMHFLTGTTGPDLTGDDEMDAAERTKYLGYAEAVREDIAAQIGL